MEVLETWREYGVFSASPGTNLVGHRLCVAPAGELVQQFQDRPFGGWYPCTNPLHAPPKGVLISEPLAEVGGAR